jgi:excisionase family DNA binding protein
MDTVVSSVPAETGGSECDALSLEEEKAMEKLLLTVPEAAQVLGVGRSQMYALLANRQVPQLRLGRSIRVPAAELATWVRRQLLGEVSPPAGHERIAQ